MSVQALFTALEPLIPAGIEREFPGYTSACILATRVAIEVAKYFGIVAEAIPCQVVAYNEPFRKRILEQIFGDPKAMEAEDGSYSVGIGFGPDRPGAWRGHLVAAADGWFADYAIQQAERADKGIVTGPALVGPCGMSIWEAVNEHGTHVEYKRIADTRYRQSPDWREPRRLKAIAGPIIREVERCRG